jgi:hypothetical protein
LIATLAVAFHSDQLQPPFFSPIAILEKDTNPVATMQPRHLGQAVQKEENLRPLEVPIRIATSAPLANLNIATTRSAKVSHGTVNAAEA